MLIYQRDLTTTLTTQDEGGGDTSATDRNNNHSEKSIIDPKNTSTNNEQGTTTTTKSSPAGSPVIISRPPEEGPSNTTKSFIPPDLVEWVEEDNRKYREAKAKWKYERSFLNLRLLFRPKALRRSDAQQQRGEETASEVKLKENVNDSVSAMPVPSLPTAPAPTPTPLSAPVPTVPPLKADEKGLVTRHIRIHESSTIQQLIDRAVEEFVIIPSPSSSVAVTVTVS
jgi:hypothetical protein